MPLPLILAGVAVVAGSAVLIRSTIANDVRLTTDDDDSENDNDKTNNRRKSKSQKDRGLKHSNSSLSGEVIAGLGAGVAASEAKIASDIPKFSIPKTGHGFAAEQANHLFDQLSGKNVQLIGNNNAKNGPDRRIDGVNVQTKYYNSAKKTVRAFLDNEGNWKYRNPDGSIMPGEVPYDQYPAALKHAKKVADVSDPKDFIKRGSTTYPQSRNIARLGTIEGLTYDASNGVILAAPSMGISAALSFAVSIWNGEDPETALKQACETGIRVGGVIWASHILATQLGRAGSLAANALRPGGSIHGATAANHVSKLSRGNLVTGIAVTAVLSSVDFARMFQGRISGAQLFKNVATTASGVAGGTVGWKGGTAVGAVFGSVVPGVGTALGAILGGLAGAVVGGYTASRAAEAVLDEFIEDDANQMLTIMKEIFGKLCVDYLLNEEEALAVLEDVQSLDLPVVLRDMYASDNRKAHARRTLKPLVENQARARKRIALPSSEDMAIQTRRILRQVAEAAD